MHTFVQHVSIYGADLRIVRVEGSHVPARLVAFEEYPVHLTALQRPHSSRHHTTISLLLDALRSRQLMHELQEKHLQ